MKKILYTLTMLLILGSTLGIQKAAAQDVRLIRNNNDWVAFCNAVQNAYGRWDVNARLLTDLTVTQPVGTYDYPYKGTFDGNGHTLNLNINNATDENVALFRYVYSATITDLRLTGTVRGRYYSAGLIGCVKEKYPGYNEVNVKRVRVSTSVNASDNNVNRLGGIIGKVETLRDDIIMEDCCFDGTFTCTSTNDPRVACIIGYLNSYERWWVMHRVYCNPSPVPTNAWIGFCLVNDDGLKHWGVNSNSSLTITSTQWSDWGVTYYNKTNQSEVVNLMNAEKADSWSVVDGKAVPKMLKNKGTSPIGNEWNSLLSGSSSGQTLSSGRYYVNKDVTYSNSSGGSGLTIAENATVYIYISEGVTLTANGGNASGKTGAGAGIELPASSTLYLMGKGNVKATGGRAANGETGGTGDDATGGNGSWTHTGAGGRGGNGGGGAGAGIGTRGGAGGSGGSGGAGYRYDNGAEDDAENGTSGSAGQAGSTANAMGNLVVSSSVHLNATGGNAGTSGGSGGQRGRGYAYDGYSYNVTVAGGGGGGGGGFGGAASPIGTGGCGGGGGGGGAGGAQDYRSNSKGGVYDVTAPGGSGGKNADGQTSGGDGTEAGTTGIANSNGWVTVENGSFNGGNDWNPASGSCQMGSGGNGGDRGDTSDGMSVANLHEYILKLNVQGSPDKTATITYKSNKSNGNVTVTIPTTYQLGLIEADKYVTKWYTNDNCTGEWKAAYDEKSIGSGTTDLYGVWQNYSERFKGTGTKTDPFIINADELVDFANYVNDGGNTRGLYFKQQGDINVSNITNNWTPIGEKRVFEGDYDGDGYRITNATMNSSTPDVVGIFGKVSGTISNLGAESCSFASSKSESRGGAIAGILLRCDMERPVAGLIRNCYVVNNTISASYSGGMVGEITNGSRLSHCLEKGNTLSGTFGGLTCKSSDDCEIDTCFASGTFSNNGSADLIYSEQDVSYDRMKSGEITWRLNDNSPYGGPWYQTLSSTNPSNYDQHPVLNKQQRRVYKNNSTYTNTFYFDGFTGIPGQGTPDNPFLITSKADLEQVATFCNSGKNSSGIYFLQTADIDMNNASWTPVGRTENDYAFQGNYDGGGHTIRRATINTAVFGGIFGVVTGTVNRLCVESVTVTGQGHARVGAVAGRVRGVGVISNCFVKSCTISGDNSSGVAGGIVADMYDNAIVRNSLSYGNTISGETKGHLCGEMLHSTTINLCYTNGPTLIGGSQRTVTNSQQITEETTWYGGEITYKLNNSAETLTPMWFQNVDIQGVDADATPLLSSDHAMVFKRNNNYTNDYSGISSLGGGTSDNPYRVASGADLKKISDTFMTMSYSNFYVKQTADIDMSTAEPIVPIGAGTSGFAGHYDGDGHVISNLSFSNCQGESLGLFNNIVSGAVVEKLGIENGTFVASDANKRVGAFAGKITGNGKLRNCYVAASTVNFNNKADVVVGALVGELADQSSIESSYGYKNTVVGQNVGGNKCFGYIVGNIGSSASATRVFTDAASLCADGQSGFNNITASERSVSEDSFKTGELTYLLNGSPAYDAVASSVWRQTIKQDLAPVLSSSHLAVWKYYKADVSQTMYTNSNATPEYATLTLNPNYNGGEATALEVFKATDSYYVPKYQLANSIPLRTNYYFAGWNTKADRKGTHYDRNYEILLSKATTLYAEWDVMVPTEGEFTASIPEGTTSIKIYDGGGYNTEYGNNYDGKLTLTVSSGHIIYLSGTVTTEAPDDNGVARDYMIVRNGDKTAAVVHNGQSTNSTNKGYVFTSTTNGVAKSIGGIQCGDQVTIEFVSNGEYNYKGLNLTATIVSVDAETMGLGTEKNPFEIADANELKMIQDYIHSTHNTNVYIRQIADIDLSELENPTLAPLDAGEASFAGHYDGCGYTIKNGTITSNGTEVGLFANLSGTVKRLCMENITISYNQNNAKVGAIAGRVNSSGSITNCRIKGIIFQDNGHTGGAEGIVAGAMADDNRIQYCLVLTTYKPVCGSQTIGNGFRGNRIFADANDFDLQSGKTCYLLNNSTSTNAVWRQTIGTDALPVPNGSDPQPEDGSSPIVYYHNQVVSETSYYGYTNEETFALTTLRVQDVAFNTSTDKQAVKGSLVRLADYAPVHDELTLVEWNTESDFSGESYTPNATLLLNSDAVILYPKWNVMPMIVPGEGTEQNPYIVDSADDWNALASNVTYFDPSFQGYAGKYIRLDADIEVSKIMGTMTAVSTQGNAFRGIFDGNGHTITATITDTEHQGTAPFCYINDATIKNLTVNGTINAGTMQHAAALVGFANGTSRIENCKVTANVIGGTHIGGILGHGLDANITIIDCLFSGLMEGGSLAKGVFAGWGNSGTKTVTNCLYLMHEGQNTDNLDLSKKYQGSESVNNCYKTTSVGSFGTQATEQPHEGEISQVVLTRFGHTMYAINPCAVSGITDAAVYDQKDADNGIINITPTLTTAINAEPLNLGNYLTATLNGDAVTQVPLTIDEVGNYTLVLTGQNGFVGSKTYHFTVIGDHVIINMAEEVGTYSSNDDLNFTGSELKAYIAAGYNKGENQVLLVHVYDVPAGTGVFLRGEAGVNYSIPKSTAQSYYVNMLKPNITAGAIPQTDGNMSNFLLAKVNDVYKFCEPSANATLGANKAYLQVPSSFITNSAREVDIVFEDDVTGIFEMEKWRNGENGTFYDLQGRPVQSTSAKGLYIRNGKKVVIK